MIDWGPDFVENETGDYVDEEVPGAERGLDEGGGWEEVSLGTALESTPVGPASQGGEYGTGYAAVDPNDINSGWYGAGQESDGETLETVEPNIALGATKVGEEPMALVAAGPNDAPLVDRDGRAAEIPGPPDLARFDDRGGIDPAKADALGLEPEPEPVRIESEPVRTATAKHEPALEPTYDPDPSDGDRAIG